MAQSKNVTEDVPEICREFVTRLERAGVNITIDRWEAGIPHHEKSEALVRDLAKIDTLYFGNYFDLKTGGDGDNGEVLMYMLDLFFELEDKEKMQKLLG